MYQTELLAVETLLPQAGLSIEIGVGSGRFAAPLGIQLGIEPSSQMAGIAQSRGIKVIAGVAEQLPLDDSRFDLVLSVTTVCFLNDVELAFQETRRVLKLGGAFIIGFVDKNSLIGKQYQKYKHENVFYRVATFYSTEEIISFLKQIGFIELRFAQTIFHNLAEIKKIETAKDGYGEGSFVVVRAKK